MIPTSAFVSSPLIPRHRQPSTFSQLRNAPQKFCISHPASTTRRCRLVINSSLSSPEHSDFIPVVHIGSEVQFESAEDDASTQLSNGGITPPPPTSGDAGGNHGDDNNNDDCESDSELSALLSENKAVISDIPGEVLTAYKSKVIPLWAVSNYLVAKSNVLSRVLLGLPAMRDRFLADKLFLLKILIEEGIGLFGKFSAEYQQRRERFWKEGEFVLANMIMALLADFALVYFPAPSLSLNPTLKSTGWLKNLTSGLPSNIFQNDRPFTFAQRVGGYGLKCSQLFMVGFLCCFSGVVITNGLVMVRERMDKNYKSETSKQNPIVMSLLYGTFLGLSSGTRYQMVNGIENIVFPKLFARSPALVEKAATFGLRYANTFWGSQQWVMFARFTKVQKLKKQKALSN